jgi:hypothetical protein
MIASRRITPKMRNVSDKTCRENGNKYFIFITFYRKSCRLEGNVGKYGKTRRARDDIIILLMRFAYRITKDTDTHSEYVTLIAFP